MSEHAEKVRRHFDANRRLALLRFLNEEPNGTLNTSILRDAMKDIGVPISRENLVLESEWLSERGLLTIESLRHLTLLTITGRGRDVVAGEITVDGVRHPTIR